MSGNASPTNEPIPEGREKTRSDRLGDLERRVRREMEYLKLPARPWCAAKADASGRTMPDVAIVGAGMFGIAAAIALILKGVSNIVLFDRSPAGYEGPWKTFARMKTLRSPKDLPGPAFNIPSLTFRAWYETVYGPEGWEALYKIPNGDWQDYLDWLKTVFALPVENGVGVETVALEDEHAVLMLGDGRRQPARRVVVATGRTGAGGPALPAFFDGTLRPALAAHSSDPIDFAALKGKRIAVVGAGASAWDNAATALEAGAAHVTMYARRGTLPQINKGRASAHPGYFEGWPDLSAERKWQLLTYLDDVSSPPPHETVHRTLANADGFDLRLGAAIESVSAHGDGVAVLADGKRETADFVILGTGFAVDITREAMFAPIAHRIARWKDRYTPPAGMERANAGGYAWLGPGFELQDRTGGPGSEIARVHLFSSAAFASFGFLSADVPGLSSAAERLSSRIVQHIFSEDFDTMKARLIAWDEEYELETTPYHAPG